MESKTKNVVIVVIILLTVAGVVLGLVFGLKSKSKSGGGGTPYPPGPGPTPPSPTPPSPTPPSPTPPSPTPPTPPLTIPPTNCDHGTFSPDSTAKGGIGYCTCNEGWWCGWAGIQSCPVEPGTKYKCNIPTPAPTPAPPCAAPDTWCNNPPPPGQYQCCTHCDTIETGKCV